MGFYGLTRTPDYEVSLPIRSTLVLQHTGGDLPAGAKTVDKHPNRRTLTKDEKEAIVVPDGCTIKLVSKYSDATKTGLEVVGPKTVKGLTELINKVRAAGGPALLAVFSMSLLDTYSFIDDFCHPCPLCPETFAAPPAPYCRRGPQRRGTVMSRSRSSGKKTSTTGYTFTVSGSASSPERPWCAFMWCVFLREFNGTSFCHVQRSLFLVIAAIDIA